jgi:hypothetical protein
MGLPLHDVRRAIAEREAPLALSRDPAQGTVEFPGYYAVARAVIAVVEGRVEDATALADSIEWWGFLTLSRPLIGPLMAIQQALIEPGYDRAAAPAAADLAVIARESESAESLCYQQLWRLSRGDTSGTRWAMERIQALARDWDYYFRVGPFGVCTALLETMLEWNGGVPTHSPALERLDSLMQRGPGMELPYNVANLMIARWRAAQGNYEAALAAMRRGMLSGPFAINPFSIPVVPAYKREMGRLAAIVGDTAGAIRAYDHYLTLRTDPDPVLQPQRDSVLAELAALVREPRGER